jgi:hypothetical protein
MQLAHIPRVSRSSFASLALRLSLDMAAATAAGAAATAAAVSLIACYILLHKSRAKLSWFPTVGFSRASGRRVRRRGLVEAIGNTPLIRINSLSDATGCEVRAWTLADVALLLCFE